MMTWARVIVFLLHSHLLLAAAPKKTYIVQMKFQQKPLTYHTHSDWYTALLQSVVKSNSPDSLLYTYDAAYHGFAASLTPPEAQSLARSDSVLAVHEDVVYSLHTTRTPLFLGLKNLALWEGSTLEKLNQASQDVVIGVIDSGVWPESQSFNDDGMPEKPRKWAGKCDPGEPNPKFCNKKLIGAMFFNKGLRNAVSSNVSASARDDEGHGTHTSSTAAGSLVGNASLFGYARGKARGVAHRARVAMYRVCWDEGCSGSDIVAAIDRATRDGVHVLSLSLGGGPGIDYDADPIAVASFGAMDKGIFVSCSAGNSGPYQGSVVNVAPWIMTVGAGTVDRDFPAFVVLGNGRNFTGVSLYSGNGFGKKPVELVYGGGKDSTSKLCMEGSLDNSVRGKVVLCDRGGGNARVEKGAVVSRAGGVGMILANTEDNGESLVADSHFLPAVAVGWKATDQIRKHMKTTKNPTALFSFGGTIVKVKPSPVVAAFSSRGPNSVTPQILKPDVVGPGVNILAAWTQAVGPTSLPDDTRRTDFNIISGTSMSCPHVSGLAALMKAAHPEWSPGAIKSALITTAHAVDNTKSPFLDAATGNISTPFGHGAGYVNLHRALTPGLIYNVTSEDYIAFLCSVGYTTEMVRSFARRSDIDCNKKLSDPGQLNYPSFSVVFGTSMVVNYSREVTNVDGDGGVYRVSVKAPENVAVTVVPSELVFKAVGEKRRYTVMFASREGVAPGKSSFGNIVWKGGKKKQVKSPVSILWDW